MIVDSFCFLVIWLFMFLFTAIWQLFSDGIHTCSWNFGSYTASMIFFNPSWLILSSYTVIPSRRIVPFPFGTCGPLKRGANIYALFFSRSTRFLMFSLGLTVFFFCYSINTHCLPAVQFLTWPLGQQFFIRANDKIDVNFGLISCDALSAILSNFVSIYPQSLVQVNVNPQKEQLLCTHLPSAGITWFLLVLTWYPTRLLRPFWFQPSFYRFWRVASARAHAAITKRQQALSWLDES